MTRTITQRELRNESAAIMDAVERGETFVITRNGRTVAELHAATVSTARPPLLATSELLRRMRGIRTSDHAAMRAEADELFGPDEIDD